MYHFLLLLCISVSSISAEKDCGQAEQCGNPFKDMRDLFICRVSNSMKQQPLEKFFKSLVTQYCNGNTIDQIGARMESTLMASGDLSLISKGMTLFGPFEKCLNEHGTDAETILQKAGRAVKTTFSQMFTEALSVVSPFKGKCNDPELFNEIGQFACPYMTHDMIKKLFITIKQEVGSSYICFKSIDNKLLFLSLYEN